MKEVVILSLLFIVLYLLITAYLIFQSTKKETIKIRMDIARLKKNITRRMRNISRFTPLYNRANLICKYMIANNISSLHDPIENITWYSLPSINMCVHITVL